MRWIYIALTILLLGLLAVFGTVGYVLLTFDDERYRDEIERLVERSTGDTLEFRGEFEFSVGRHLSLRASDISYRTADGATRVVIRRGEVKIDWLRMFRGTLLIEELDLEGVEIEITDTVVEANRDADSDSGWAFLPVVVRGSVREVELTYQGAGDTLRVLIEILEIREPTSDEPLHVSGRGHIDDRPIDISGNLGRVAELWNPPVDGFPIQVELIGRYVQLEVTGVVGAPLEGEGIDLTVTARSTELDRVVRPFWPDVPRIRSFILESHLTGDARSVRLDSMTLRVRGTGATRVQMHGTIGDLNRLQDVDLHAVVSIAEPTALRKMLPEGLENVDRIVARASVRGEAGNLALDDFAATVTLTEGWDIAVTGKTRIFDAPDGSTHIDADLDGMLLEPPASLARQRRDLLTEVGTAHLSLAMHIDDDGLIVDSFRIRAGSLPHLRIEAEGKLKRIPFVEDEWFSGLTADLQFESERPQSIATLFDLPVTLTGGLHLHARVSGSAETLTLSDIDVVLGDDESVSLTLEGEIDVINLFEGPTIDTAMLDLTGRSASLGHLAQTIGIDLARSSNSITLDARVIRSDASYELERLVLQDEQGDATFMLSGRLGSPTTISEGILEGVDLEGRLELRETTRLGELVGWERHAEIGPLSLGFSLVGELTHLSVDGARLVFGERGKIYGDFSASIENTTPPMGGIRANGTVTAKSTSMVGDVFGAKIPDLGALRLDMSISDADGSLGIEKLELNLASGGVDVITMSGGIDDVLAQREISWDGEFHIELETLLEDIIGEDIGDLGTLEGELSISDEDGSLGIERFSIKTVGDQAVLELTLEGVFDDVINGEEFKANATISVSDMSLLASALDMNLFVAGPVRVRGSLAGGLDDLAIEGDVLLGRTLVNAKGNISLTGKVPRVEAKLDVPILYAMDFAVREGVSEKPEELTSDRIFSRDPLDLSWLRQVELMGSLHVERVEENPAMSGFSIEVNIGDGVAKISPIDFVYAGGRLLGHVEMTYGDPSALKVDITGDDVVLGALLSQVQTTPTITGDLNLSVALQSRGNSPHELASNLEGHLGFVLENGAMSRRLLNLVALDVLGWTISRAGMRESTAQISCLLARFEVNAGIIQTQAFFLESPRMRLTGTGEVNLGEETLDVTLVPDHRRTLWASATPVRLQGSLAAPSVTAIPLNAVGRDVAGFLLIPQFYIPARALGYLFRTVADEDASDSACLYEPEAQTPSEPGAEADTP